VRGRCSRSSTRASPMPACDSKRAHLSPQDRSRGSQHELAGLCRREGRRTARVRSTPLAHGIAIETNRTRRLGAAAVLGFGAVPAREHMHWAKGRPVGTGEGTRSVAKTPAACAFIDTALAQAIPPVALMITGPCQVLPFYSRMAEPIENQAVLYSPAHAAT
jgi:hypothetical protein